MTQTTAQDIATESARERVRRILIRPLLAEGAVRPRKVTAEAHEAELAKLAEKLAYLDAPMLETLAEVVRGMMGGARHNEWPAFLTIWGEATRLRQPPDDERHIMVTWLRSVEGPVAQAGGYLVELHGYLRKFGRPPNEFAMKQIRSEAEQNRRDMDRIRDRIARGVAGEGERAALAQYMRRLEACQQLVADGAAKREDQRKESVHV